MKAICTMARNASCCSYLNWCSVLHRRFRLSLNSHWSNLLACRPTVLATDLVIFIAIFLFVDGKGEYSRKSFLHLYGHRGVRDGG